LIKELYIDQKAFVMVGETLSEACSIGRAVRQCCISECVVCVTQDHDGASLCLSATHMGIVVFQNLVRINTFSWAKIRKLSFRRRRFLIKLHPEGYVCCRFL